MKLATSVAKSKRKISALTREESSSISVSVMRVYTTQLRGYTTQHIGTPLGCWWEGFKRSAPLHQGFNLSFKTSSPESRATFQARRVILRPIHGLPSPHLPFSPSPLLPYSSLGVRLSILSSLSSAKVQRILVSPNTDR